MRTAKLLVCAALLTLLGQTASANPFTRLWVFGDSTVDTGWYKVPKANSNPPTYSGEPSFDFYLAPSTPGGPTGAEQWDIGKPTVNPERMSVQELAHLLGVTARPHNQLNSQNQPGTNYATSGARNKEYNDANSGRFPNAIPTQIQINHYLNKYVPNGRALYVISSGGNDVAAALDAANGMCTADAKTAVEAAADGLAKKIHTLQANHAKYIIVANLPESYGDAEKQNCRQDYDATLQSKLNSLGVEYAWGDVNAVRGKMEGLPNTYGLDPNLLGTNNAACSPPPNIGSSWALLCSLTSRASTPSNADTSEFADNEHWAPAAQKVLGTYYLCLAKNTWPSLFAASPAPHEPPFACSLFDSSWS